MNIPRPVASLMLFSTILTSGAVAQSTPPDSSQDQRILTEVKTRFASGHAFDGMSISPSVRHAIVTLSGTVNSQAAKVLASKEIEDVDGIKSVMNNLNVAGGTANARPSGAAAGEVEDKKVILPFGTILPVHLSNQRKSARRLRRPMMCSMELSPATSTQTDISLCRPAHLSRER